MSGEIFNKPASQLRILVAPLDWGIGHATRCVPIIYALINAGAKVFLAGDANTEIILTKEFPALAFLPLKGYNVKYSKHKRWLLLKLLSQFPSIKRTVHYEQVWTTKVVRQNKIDAIISDNRFGLYHPAIPCVYVTHQLFIKTGYKWLNILAQKLHYSYINRFSECWVPDAEGSQNLGGSLSHPGIMPAVPVTYLGLLSRLIKLELHRTNPLLVVLSGPEPQRSIFEQEILRQLGDFPSAAILVRGLPAETGQLKVSENLVVRNYVSAQELSELIQASQLVLARAGYSTVMDLAHLKQRAILVPTPGQTEQEYLARSLKMKGIFYSCSQQGFTLKDAIAQAEGFYKNSFPQIQLFDEELIAGWLLQLENSKALQ